MEKQSKVMERIWPFIRYVLFGRMGTFPDYHVIKQISGTGGLRIEGACGFYNYFTFLGHLKISLYRGWAMFTLSYPPFQGVGRLVKRYPSLAQVHYCPDTACALRLAHQYQAASPSDTSSKEKKVVP